MGTETISSINDYLLELDAYKGTNFFRGQSDESWDLAPSIYRNNNYILNEHQMLEEVSIKHPEEFATFKGTYPQLLKAQHYGLPTRLLDITTNPLIALYFASNDKNALCKDGKIFLIENIAEDKETQELKKKFIALIATNPNKIFQNEITDKLYKKHDIIYSLSTPEIFIAETTFNDSNQRSFRQGAHSIVFGVKVTSSGLVDKTEKISFPQRLILKEFIVPSKIKPQILEMLDFDYGISEKTLLLSIENTTSYIKQMYEGINPNYKYTVNLLNSLNMDIFLFRKYSYPTIKEILNEVDSKQHVMQYRVFINQDDLRSTNLICRAKHSKKHFSYSDPLKIDWYYNYDGRRIYERN